VLLEHHAKLLSDRAISPEIAGARGYRTAENGEQLGRLGFKQYQRRAGLIIPICDVHGERTSSQLRPDSPRKAKSGKYENVGGSKIILDVNPAVSRQLRDATIPLDITEGPLKGDAGNSKGLCCVALLGVYAWKRDGKALPDWDLIELADRVVSIIFDSDIATNPNVAQARDGLTAFLQERGARVYHITLLPAADGSKVGLDDYFAAGHTVEELRALATPAPLAARMTLSLVYGAGEGKADTVDDPWTGDYASSLLSAGHTAAFVGVYAKLLDIPPLVFTKSIMQPTFTGIAGALGAALDGFNLSTWPQGDWSGEDRPTPADRTKSCGRLFTAGVSIKTGRFWMGRSKKLCGNLDCMTCAPGEVNRLGEHYLPVLADTAVVYLSVSRQNDRLGDTVQLRALRMRSRTGAPANYSIFRTWNGSATVISTAPLAGDDAEPRTARAMSGMEAWKFLHAGPLRAGVLLDWPLANRGAWKLPKSPGKVTGIKQKENFYFGSHTKEENHAFFRAAADEAQRRWGVRPVLGVDLPGLDGTPVVDEVLVKGWLGILNDPDFNPWKKPDEPDAWTAYLMRKRECVG
jgi:hypothetical protein